MKPWEIGLVAAGSIAGGLLVAWPVFWWYEVARLEKPKYTVIRQLAAGGGARTRAELRLYAPCLVAETVVQLQAADGSRKAPLKEAGSQGFRRIAGYIFGKNVAQGEGGSSASESVAMTSPVQMELPGAEKVAMTSPVQMDLPEEASPTYKMAFVMPSKYTLSTLPTPKNPDVVLKEIPSRTLAALTFSGHVNQACVDKRKQELLSVMQAEGLKPVGSVKLFQYHPPFCPGFVRKNEVLYEVAPVAE